MKKKTEAASRRRHTKSGEEQRKRILVLDNDKLKPNSEGWHFLRRLVGKCERNCIEIVQQQDGESDSTKQVFRISEDACPKCTTRAKQCPGVKIVNLPSNLATDTTHRYGPNSFKLHGLPMPRPGNVLGLVGGNGLGKSTALKILAGAIKPNLGETSATKSPTWDEIVRYYRGSDLQNYFKHMVNGDLRCATKPQLGQSFVQRYAGQTVQTVLQESSPDHSQRGEDVTLRLVQQLGLSHLLDRQVQELSGGERQRLAVCLCAMSNADVYLFDEPTSFLDVKQRLVVAEVIRDIVGDGTAESYKKYVVVVEHDLTILDYISDYVCCLYGEPGVYGVVSQRSTTANGINQFINGYIKGENLRFRAEPLSYHLPADDDDQACIMDDKSIVEHRYPNMSKTFFNGANEPSFTLRVEAGGFRDGEIVGLLAQNGAGKTTFADLIASHVADSKPPSQSGDDAVSKKRMTVSYKRQHLPRFFGAYKGTVEKFLDDYMQWGQANRLFSVIVKKPLKIDSIKDLPVRSLSTGELQRLSICLCLGTPAQLYLIDEPSAFLDSEQRLVVAKVIKRWIVSHLNMPAFVIEHDMVMASTLYDRVIVYTGVPGVECTAAKPTLPSTGLNAFLRQLDVTICSSRNTVSNRPRINKRGSRRDREQKASGNYFAIESASA